jgi:hypothetical protein
MMQYAVKYRNICSRFQSSAENVPINYFSRNVVLRTEVHQYI